MIRIILRLIIELAIAVGIFFLLVKYTALFDADLFEYQPTKNARKQTVPDTTQYPQRELASNSGLHGLNIEETYTLHGGAMILSDDILAKVEKNLGLTTEKKNSDKQSCTVPRSATQSVPHGQSLVAYSTTRATQDNICNGTLRTCENGILQGDPIYRYENCSYTIDGINNGVEVIPGASSYRHELFVYTKGENDPQEFIQPERFPAKNTKAIFDVHGKRIAEEVNKGNTERDNSIKTTEQYNIQDFVDVVETETPQNCKSPRNTYVQHGKHVVARNTLIAGPGQSCLLEYRPCIDGSLLGSYTYKTCYPKEQHITSTTIPVPEDPKPEPTYIPRGNPIKDDELQYWHDPCCTLQNVTETPINLSTGQGFTGTCSSEIVTIQNMAHAGVCSNIGCTSLIPGVLIYVATDTTKTVTTTIIFTNTRTNKTATLTNQEVMIQAPEDTISISYPSALLDATIQDSLLHTYIKTDITVQYTTSCGTKNVHMILEPNDNKDTCKKEGEGVNIYQQEVCCAGLETRVWKGNQNECIEIDPEIYYCTAKCGNGMCDAKESKCTCPQDCDTTDICAKEGEKGRVGPLPPEYNKRCCTGLSELVTSPTYEKPIPGASREFICYDAHKGTPHCKSEFGRYYDDRSLLARDKNCKETVPFDYICGDKICDDFERMYGKCPQDCAMMIE